MYQSGRQLRTFAEMLDNIFIPLFEVSVDPSSHPKLHLLLQQVVGFDCVDDESKAEGPLPTPYAPAVHPEQWTDGNPHYAYYSYYLYANLHVLNQLRSVQGLSTFCYRPHAGEAGELNHLHAAFLTARGINHGINLRKTPSLQYLYYLCQIGLALSPLSNNALFLQLSKNPFHEFFSVGLNVSLSTDDPLMFHHTREPLMEEYTIAKQVWKLSAVDLSEAARNSVLQSSFPPHVKAFWIGSSYRKGGAAGNDINRTNVPQLRCEYREVALAEELRVVHDAYLHALVGRPQLSPSHRVISNATIAAKHLASVGNTPTPPSPQARPVAKGPASPPRAAGELPVPMRREPSKYEPYDGPFARLYEPQPNTFLKRLEGDGHAPASPSASAPLPPRLPPSMLAKQNTYEDISNPPSALASSRLVQERLDEQHKMLLQAQELAAASEARAEAAMRMNRYIMIAGLVVAVGAALVRSR
jgi:adenosine deaminase